MTTKLSAPFAVLAALWICAFAQPSAPPGARVSVDLSPDGRTLAFDSRGAIFTVPVGGGRATRLTSGASRDATPMWSPDGHRIAFVRSEGRRANVWIVDRQTQRIAPVTRDTTPRRIVSLSWAADGGEIAIAFGTSARGFAIVDVGARQSFPFDAKPMGRRGSRAVHSLAFAKDGSSVIIQGGDAGADGQQLYRFVLPVRDQRAISDERHGALSPVFSFDGSRLAFLTRADSGGYAIEIRDVAAARQRVAALIPLPAAATPDAVVEPPHYALAPDGAAAFIGVNGSLWRVDLTTGRRQAIPVDVHSRK